MELSRVYDDGRTTIPKTIRAVLGVEEGDSVAWSVSEDRRHVRVSKVPGYLLEG